LADIKRQRKECYYAYGKYDKKPGFFEPIIRLGGIQTGVSLVSEQQGNYW